MKLQIGGFLNNSLVNGEGIRAVVFVSGCMHNCKGCQNVDMQDFNYGDCILIDDIMQKIKNNMPIIKGVTLSGGEPFESAMALSKLAEGVKELGLDIWCYSGYTYDQLINSEDKDKLRLLNYIDVLIDGKFEESLKIGDTKYIGSSNQRIINAKKSILRNEIVMWSKQL